MTTEAIADATTGALTDGPRPGDVVHDRYRIDAVLGAGGFGTVFAATDRVLDRAVALKLLARARLDSDDARARFRREAQALATLAGEHGAQIYDVGELADGRPFITMERLHGHDLAHELTGGPLPVAAAASTVIAVCRGLRAAHARGIVHRDLKPSNVFCAIGPDGARTIKVLDFGIARMPAAESLTRSDAWVGTPRYMSPEQLISPASVDTRADVWALGVLLYELLTTKGLFDAPTPAAYASKILTDRPVPLRVRDPALPAELERVVDRCLQPIAGDRYPDVDQLAAALARFAQPGGDDPHAPSVATTMTGAVLAPDPATAPATSAAPTERARRATRVAAGLAGVLAAGVIASVGIGVLGRGSPAVPPSSSTIAAPAARAAPVDASPEPAAPSARPPARPSTAGTVLAYSPTIPPVTPRSPNPTPTPLVSPAEERALADLCRSDAAAAPRLVVAGNDGPAAVQCARLAELGCRGLRRRCRATDDPEVRRQCTGFLATAESRGACR